MNEKGYRSGDPAASWEEAMLCGNGTLGALVMGTPLRERVVLTHEKLFLPLHEKLPPVDMASRLGEIRAMLARGEYQRAADDVVELSRREGYGEKRWTDPFFPAAELRLSLRGAREWSDYGRSLSFETGLAAAEYQADGKAVREEAFVSRADGLVFLRLTREEPGDVLLELMPFAEDTPASYWFGPLHASRLGEASYEHAVRAVSMRVSFPSGGGYACCLRVIAADGEAIVSERGLLLRGTGEALLCAALLPSADEGAWDAFLARTDSLPLSFPALLERHAALHGALLGRVRLDLHGGAERELSAEALWEKSRSGSVPNAFYEKIFDAGRYEILSSCGDWPPNLQGVWTGTYAVPWSSDYTNNGNVQTAIASLLSGNMAECMKSWFSYLDFLLPDMRENARRLFGCRGIHLPSRSSTHGLNNHFDSTWPMTFWTAGAGWAARFYVDHWLYTGDDAFFLEKGLPFLREAALFYEDFLVEGDDGYLHFTPSYSPENAPANTGSQACVDATMDLAVARELFTNLLTACRTLGVEGGSLPKWESILRRLPPYRVNDDGALSEWACPALEDCYDHRHASHLYPLFYGISREFRESRRLFDACRRTYEIKNERKKKEKGVMAFGMVQAGLAAAHLGDAAALGETIEALAANHYYRTFATSHDAGPSIFNADLSGGMPALMLEALAQSYEAVGPEGTIDSYDIVLLPALPSFWPSGSVTGMRLRGGFALSLWWENGRVARYELENPLGNPYRVESGEEYFTRLRREAGE